MCAEASTVLRAVAADFFFNSWWCLRSRISMLEVEAVPQSCIP
jgi:hypothetical protein